jgi:hypothetical protein
MAAIIEEYLAYLQSQGRSPAAVRATRSDLAGFQQWWEQRCRRPFSIEEWVTRDWYAGMAQTVEDLPLAV